MTTTFEIGVVIAGAGARGAYEAGLLAHLLPEIASRVQETGQVARFSFVGTSAGSLNSVLIASRAPRVTPDHSPPEVHAMWTEAMGQVTRVWGGIHEHHVIALLSPGRIREALGQLVLRHRWPWYSLLSVDPLEDLARDPDVVDWGQLHQRVAEGTVGAVGVAVTGRDGRTVIFLDRHGEHQPIPRDDTRDIDYARCPDGILGEHVLASSAIPCLFPAQRITTPSVWAGWYYDGGVRLNTPLKPAIKLGLRHLLIVGTHPDRYVHDGLPNPTSAAPEIDEAAVPVANQVMADQLIQDLQTLRSRNKAQPTEPVRYLFAGPPTFHTLADLAGRTPTSWTFARMLRTALGPAARDELSSYLLFDPGYLQASVDEGRTRAEAASGLGPGSAIGWRT